MEQKQICTFVIEPAVDDVCSNYAVWWVKGLIGTGRLERRWARCAKHVIQTATFLSVNEYPFWFNGVERIVPPAH